MKTNEEYIDWNELESLMDNLYTIVDISNDSKTLNSIQEYLTKNSNLSNKAAKKLGNQIIQSIKEERNESGEIPYCILFRKVFEFQNYQDWDDELYEAAMEFREAFTLFPNIAIFNKQTSIKIEMIANNVHKENIKREQYQNPETDEFAVLSSFETDEFSLNFATDDSLADRKFILVFDSDPDWGDGGESEELPERVKKRKAA